MVFQPRTHFTAESTEAMRIKCLAHGHNILMQTGFNLLISVSRNQHLSHMTTMLLEEGEVDGGICMRGSDEKLCFSERERGIVWKDCMKRIMNDENDLGHNVKGDAVEGPVVYVSREDV